MSATPRFLTLSEILIILRDQITRYGGAFGVRDMGLASSAAAAPQANYEGHYLNGTEIEDPDDRLYPAMMSIASGKGSKAEIAQLFRDLAT